MSYYLVKYWREGLTTTGQWIPIMDSGFITNDCTLAEVKTKVAEIVGWHDGINSRISTPHIELISEEKQKYLLSQDMCFWPKQLEKMTNCAIERFRQHNC
jgi:hypothetical protein